MQTNTRLIRKENYEPKELNLHETLFHNANGYIGIRGTLEEGVPTDYPTMRGQYIAGTYEIIPMKQAESLCNLVEEKQTMINVCDTQTIRLSVNGEEFAPVKGGVKDASRVLDMEEGYTERTTVWKSPAGNEIRVRIRRMAHFGIKELFTIEYEVEALNFSGEAVFDSVHMPEVANYSDPDDPRLADESPCYLKSVEKGFSGNRSFSVAETAKSGVRIAVATDHTVVSESRSDSMIREEGNALITRLRVPLKQNEKIAVIKYAAFSDSIRESDPKGKVMQVLKDAMKRPLSELYLAQKEYLSDFHAHSRMEIEGDAELNDAVLFNTYQLLCAAPHDAHSGIAAKGLSGEGYEGHFFWDTEMYVVPFFVLTDPTLAKNILSFRYATLPAARENATLLGHKKGALYPWRTITGVECSGYFPSGSAAYHINGAVAYAVIQYYLATGDADFMVTMGLEILLETARLWLDTGVYDREGRFCIQEVTGPDEYTCMVNNNYYTNASAKNNLRFAADLYEQFRDRAEVKKLAARLKLDKTEIADMKKAAEKMYLPYDEAYGINPQDDSFLDKPVWDLANTPKDVYPLLLHYHPLHLYRYQVCKQADTVLSHFLFPDLQSKETMENSFRYYEKITTHDSSLSTCVFSMTASMLGLKEEALAYFGDSAKLDLMNRHENTKDGVHTANMGGCYMAIVSGFAGLRITDEGLSVNPYVPKGLSRYSFPFAYRGRRLKLTVEKNSAKLELVSGDALEFGFRDTRAELGKEEPWVVKL
ncbi:MAG: glycoside hydrolase family 65 protein [Lachnospiraceae bacterium]|nr:glycoside hydrolase family 65 protein [Lachnospiraceae bacterium]